MFAHFFIYFNYVVENSTIGKVGHVHNLTLHLLEDLIFLRLKLLNSGFVMDVLHIPDNHILYLDGNVPLCVMLKGKLIISGLVKVLPIQLKLLCDCTLHFHNLKLVSFGLLEPV